MARLKVRDAILSLYQFPVGMEMFGAVSEDQWSVIKRDIDESDCYVLIIGKLFGSEVPGEGISYTQKEFRYARDKGIPIFAFILDNNVRVSKTFKETEHYRIEKLHSFISEVQTGRTVDYWKKPDELAAKVTASLAKFINASPKGGWIKEESAPNVNTSDAIERHSSTFITRKGDEQQTLFCSRCYDVDSRFVQLDCYKGGFRCPNCGNSGIYDIDEFQALSRQVNSHSGRRVVSDGIDVYRLYDNSR